MPFFDGRNIALPPLPPTRLPHNTPRPHTSQVILPPLLVDGEEDLDEILARGHDVATVRRIEHLLYIAEYKRRQAPPGVKLTSRNFGRDRRYPIVNAFRDRT